MIYFFYSWPETLDCTLSNTKFLTLPPNLVFQNSLHRQFIHIKYVVSRWSSGNRRRATSAREVIEVAGSNHAIGVILNLAWGPNNFSPSMIWSLRTRSNSQTGLGAEELLPAKLHFCFCCFSLLFLLIIIIFILFFPFPLFLFQSSFLFRATLLTVSYILNPVMFFLLLRSRCQRLFFLKIEMVLFGFNRFMYFFFASFPPFMFLMYYPFQALHPSIANAS